MLLYVLLSFVLLAAYIFSQRKPKNFPPGPWGFPLLGHLPLLGLEPHKTAIGWVSKYGPILGVNFASFPCVIITDYKLAKEAFSIPELCGRPKVQIAARRSGGTAHGLLLTSGKDWREQRAFTVKRLRQLGVGTKSMESVLVDQAQEMIAGLRERLDRPGDTHCAFFISFWNALWALLAGEPLKQSDPTILRFTKLIVDGVAAVNVFTMLSMFMPWFANNFPTWITKDDHLDNLFRGAEQLFQPHVDQHWKTRVPGEPRDFIDAYMDEIEASANKPGSSFHGKRGELGLMATLLDLFLAGIETTGSTFDWIMLLLASYPEVQDKLAAEILEKVGTHRHPSLTDRCSMPYTEAILHEVMRFRSLNPLGMYHSSTEDVQFHGYNIPKDTMLFINAYEAHNNKELWGDPENFRPERWLKKRSKGQSVEFVRQEGFVTFSTGKRICIGEQLARDQLFLFTTCMFQALKVSIDPNSPPPSLEPKVGSSTAGTRPHTLVYSERRWK